MTKFVVKKKKKRTTVDYWQLRLQLSTFHWGKILLSHQAQFLSSPKYVSQQFHICEKLPQMQCHAVRSMSGKFFYD